jgi:chromosome segregation ATPase
VKERCQEINGLRKELSKRLDQIDVLSGKLEKYRKSSKCLERENKLLKEELKFLNEGIEKFENYQEECREKRESRIKKVRVIETTFDGNRTVTTACEESLKSPRKDGKKTCKELRLDPRDLENHM